jgi:DMSO/TMAO reductase YedYZ molybdopterin-dependent catalytic subunit
MMGFDLEINGAVVHPLNLAVDDVRQQYPPHTIAIQFQNDDHIFSATFTGARLWDILQTVGVNEADPHLRIMARAADRFRCLIRWHEVDPATGDRLILVAYEQDGAPLPAEDGPLRLVIPGDERGRRYLRNLVSLTVLGSGEDEE